MWEAKENTQKVRGAFQINCVPAECRWHNRPCPRIGNLRHLLGRLNCNTSPDITIHISVMQLHTAVLDQSGSHINFTCRWNKSTVAVTWSYILLYFEELPEYLRCASRKLRPQHGQEFGFVLYNYDISYIWSLLHGLGSDASNTVETSVHIRQPK